MPATAIGQFWDMTYAEPTLDWLRGPFWDWFLRRRWEIGLKDYSRRNDCDNFARAYAQAAQDCWAATAITAGRDAEAVAVGVFAYHSETLNGPHAIAVASVSTSDPVFIEPQTGAKYDLSTAEFNSCFFYEY
jgi:hypothetical protein